MNPNLLVPDSRDAPDTVWWPIVKPDTGSEISQPFPTFIKAFFVTQKYAYKLF
jgi:hypothetical protein